MPKTSKILHRIGEVAENCAHLAKRIHDQAELARIEEIAAWCDEQANQLMANLQPHHRPAFAQAMPLQNEDNGASEKPAGQDYTMRQLYEKYLKPGLQGRANQTLLEYGTIINDWERLADNATASQLTREVVLAFREGLMTEDSKYKKKRSIATINKKMRTLSPFIRLAWPPDSNNPGGMGLCEYFKMPVRMKEEQKIPRTFDEKQLNALYEAAAAAEWPEINASHTWRTLFALHYQTGMRTYDLFSLTWENIDFDYLDGMGAVVFTAKKTTKLQRIPFHPIVRTHLKRLKEISSSRKLFPGFRKTNYKRVTRVWVSILNGAGINDRRHIEDFRKTCNTMYNQSTEGSGSWILGHSLNTVNAQSYFDPTGTILKAVKRLPIPEAFSAGARQIENDWKQNGGVA